MLPPYGVGGWMETKAPGLTSFSKRHAVHSSTAGLDDPSLVTLVTCQETKRSLVNPSLA